MSTEQERKSEDRSVWMGIACVLLGMALVAAFDYVTEPDRVVSLDKAEIKAEAEAAAKAAVKAEMGEYPKRDLFLEIIREEVGAERAKRIKWERECIAWVQSLFRGYRPGAPGVPGAVGAAPSIPPPPVEDE